MIRRAALLLLLAASGGCDREGVPANPANPANADTAETMVHRRFDAEAIESAGHLTVTLGEDDVSLLLSFELADADHGIGITGIRAPDGTWLHRTVFELDSWEAASFESVVATEPIADAGELALYLPVTPAVPLEAGVYRVEFETDPAGESLVGVEATIKRAASRSAELDASRQVIDVHLHVLHPDPVWRGRAFARDVERDWRRSLEGMLAPHALGIGRLDVTVAEPGPSTRLAWLDDETEIGAACRATRLAGRTASGDSPPGEALHVSFVAGIADEFGDDWLTGLSPQPGLPYAPASPDACVFIAAAPWQDVEDPRTRVELLTANLVHELGHFVGLAHPSEADGTTFDLLGDTPRCPQAEPAVCGIAGGAGNVMFLSGDVEDLPWTLSADQAWVLRRHPLFRPAAGR